MSTLIARNERKARAKAVLYTLLVIGGLAGLLYLSGETDGIMELVNSWLGNEQLPEAPVAEVARNLDHRVGNG